MSLLRVGPVHFQPLEQELEPVSHYVRGRMLNAGCGTRDIGAYLSARGATAVTRYDIASDDPEVVIGPLESMPFEDQAFDSALCNEIGRAHV